MSVSFKGKFDRDGCQVALRLFAPEEVDRLREHFMTLRRRGSYPLDLVGERPGSRDPLRRYPRMAQMHRWDDTTLRWLLDRRIRRWLTALLGAEPYAVQSMLYFKPPGSRGQALHQDNFYLRAEPGTCIAAWMALDRADENNGCMLVVPGSQHWPILCTHKADTRLSFTDVTVPIPDEHSARAVKMDPATCCSSTARWCTAACRTPPPTDSGGPSSVTTSKPTLDRSPSITIRRCGWTAPPWISRSRRAAAPVASGPSRTASPRSP
jgi:phytanoyl-CoA hydroxylase